MIRTTRLSVTALAILAMLAIAAAPAPSDPALLGVATLSNINLNDAPTTRIFVAPGEDVALKADFRIDHTQADGTVFCSGCVDILAVAFAGSPQPAGCFNRSGNVRLFHGASGSSTIPLGAAPTTPGRYDIEVRVGFQFTCADGWSNPNNGGVVADVVVLPVTKSDCKLGKWEVYTVFANQGDCVSWVATEGRNAPSNA